MKIDPRWRTSSVIDLCEQFRADNDYSRLPILGDALMDAGCDDSALIEACQKTTSPIMAQRLVAIVLSDELAAAVKWIEEFIENVCGGSDYYEEDTNYSFSVDYEEVTQAAMSHIPSERQGRWSDWITLPFQTPDVAYTDRETFWKHFEAITGKQPEDSDETIFSCAC